MCHLYPKIKNDTFKFNYTALNKIFPPGLRGPRRRCVLWAAGVPLHRPRGEEGEAGCRRSASKSCIRIASELHPKVRNHGEGPSRGHLRDYEPSDGTF